MPDKSYFQTGWVVDDLDRSIERFLATTSVGPFFVMRHLELTVTHRGRPSEIDFSLPLREAREQFERAYLLRQLQQVGGSVGKLAKAVGMERTHLYRKLRDLGVDVKNVARDGEA